MPSSRIETGELTELVARKARRELRINPRDLPRLADLVISLPPGDQVRGKSGKPASEPKSSGSLAAGLRFDDGPEGFPRLHLAITGDLALECQRCLQPVAWHVKLETRLTVLSNEAQAGEIADPFDSIVVDGDSLSMEVVIEDEILAALPMAPVHGPGTECAESAGVETDSGIEPVQTHRPFSDLASLMGRAENDRSD